MNTTSHNCPREASRRPSLPLTESGVRPVRKGVALALLLAAVPVFAADDVNPAGPVIYYDGFERPMRYWNGGTLTTEKAVRPDTQSRKMAASQDKKSSYIQLKLSDMKVTLLGTAAANQISVGCFVYGKELKAVRIEFNGKETYSYTEDNIPDDKWTEVSCNVAQATRDRRRPPNDFAFTSIKVVAIPKSGGAPTAYVDDFILTAGTTPRAAWPQMIAADTQRASRSASAASDGFEYSEPMDAALREHLKDSLRKPAQKGVLSATLGSTAEGMLEALKAASKRTINPLTPPEGQKFASTTDLRLMLPAAMKDNASDFVVFNIPARAFMNLNAAEAVLISQRCTSIGAIPVWVVPVFPPGIKAEEVKKLDENQKRVTKEFAAKGIPYVVLSHAIKDVKEAWDGEDLKPDAQKALAKLVETALTHTERNAKGRL